jgi:hypothetical protein
MNDVSITLRADELPSSCDGVMSTVARRRLPEDPHLAARLYAERLREIRDSQRLIAECWRCGQRWDGADASRCEIDGDGWPVCTDKGECRDRAARAGLLLVRGGLGDGGAS